MNKYEVLETMLENIFEHGADIESSLAEFPEFAEELRPLLQSAMSASALAAPPASADVARRGRTRLLAQAAKIRDTAPASRVSFFSFRLATAALTLLLVFFVGGTGIVNASASALPGDNLYAVKRGWESAHFWFADEDKTASLEAEYEEERRGEVQELLGGGRLAAVRFEGVVSSLNGSKWEVAGVPVIVSKEADVEDAIQVGSDVIVSGQTQSDGTVLAEMIVLSGHSEDHIEIPVESPEAEIETADEPEESEIPESEEDEDVEITETPEPDDNDDDEEEITETPEPGDDNVDDDGDDDDGVDNNTPIPEADEGDEPDEPDEEDEADEESDD